MEVFRANPTICSYNFDPYKTTCFNLLSNPLALSSLPPLVFHISLFSILTMLLLSSWRTYSASSMFPKSTHETFSQKLYQTFKSHPRFLKPKLSRTGFTIAHYAGEVYWMFNVSLHLKSLMSVHTPHYKFMCLYLYTGPISIRAISRQKQRLCCSRTSRYVDCFRVLFYIRSFPSIARGGNQVFQQII